MDVINISGVDFRMKPDVTVGHVLEVFKGFGREGVIMRNDAIEFLDSPIEFNSVYPYKFIDSADILKSDSVNYRPGLEYLPKVTEFNGQKELYKLPCIMTDRDEKFAYSAGAYLHHPISMMDRPISMMDRPISMIDRPISMIDRPVSMMDRTLTMSDRAVSKFDKGAMLLDQSADILGRPASLSYLPTSLLSQNPVMKYQPSMLAAKLPIGQAELLSERDRDLKLYASMIAKRMQGISQNKSLSQDSYLEPKFYQFVIVKAQQDKYLDLNDIAVYNLNGDNIVHRAGILSDGLTSLGMDPIYRQFRNQRNMLRSPVPGGCIRLRFDENRSDSISRIVLRKGLSDLKGSRLFTGAMLEVRKVTEYALDTDVKEFSYMNLYPNDMINVIEIRAPSDKFLQLKQLLIIDPQEQIVRDVMRFDSNDLAVTDNDLKAQLLFQLGRLSEDYFQCAQLGGYIRLTLPRLMPVKAVQLVGELQGVKVTMERTHSYNCSSDIIQDFVCL